MEGFLHAVIRSGKKFTFNPGPPPQLLDLARGGRIGGGVLIYGSSPNVEVTLFLRSGVGTGGNRRGRGHNVGGTMGAQKAFVALF